MSQSNLSTIEQEAATDAILDIDLNVQAKKGPDLRKDHTKSHGLVWGEFEIEADIPESLKVGVFSQPKTYPMWMRLSNAASVEKRGTLKSDLDPDVRAMAIKLLQVEGPKLMDDEQETQDFLLINHPVFFVRDAQGFANLMKASVGQANPEELSSLGSTFKVLEAVTSKQVANPLLIQYWSTTPYQLGSQSIKFSVKPHEQDTPSSIPTSATYLREAVVRYLTDDRKDAIFDFLVQIYINDEKTPIEEPMQEWKEQDSPFIKLATLTIPAQKFDFAERHRFDEGLSFMAWHTLQEHAPLGSVNLARRKVYQEIVKARRSNMHQRIQEPQAYSSVLDDPE